MPQDLVDVVEYQPHGVGQVVEGVEDHGEEGIVVSGVPGGGGGVQAVEGAVARGPEGTRTAQ